MAVVVNDGLWFISITVVHNVGLCKFLKFNSRRCERRPLNLLKAVIHNDDHCQPIPKRTSFGIILKLDLHFGFFFSKCTIHVQNSYLFPHINISQYVDPIFNGQYLETSHKLDKIIEHFSSPALPLFPLSFSSSPSLPFSYSSSPSFFFSPFSSFFIFFSLIHFYS